MTVTKSHKSLNKISRRRRKMSPFLIKYRNSVRIIKTMQTIYDPRSTHCVTATNASHVITTGNTNPLNVKTV